MANEDKATRYQRLVRRATVARTGLAVLALLLLVLTGAAPRLHRVIEDAVSGQAALGTVVFAAAIVMLLAVARMPVAWYLRRLHRAYGMSTPAIGPWWRETLVVGAAGLALLVVAALALQALMAALPRLWWLVAVACGMGVLVTLAHAAPIVLLRFQGCAPLGDPVLVERLLRLACRVGAPAFGVFEWRVGPRGRHATAALAGLGSTRRILLADTLLADHSHDEIEVIVAHELAHHVYGDLSTTLAVQGGVAVLAGAAVQAVMHVCGRLAGLAGPADPAGLPLLALAVVAVLAVTRPVLYALSRAQERRADRFALEATCNPGAFVTAVRRLGSQHLADADPTRLVELLFCSHPPLRARIAAAQAWRRPIA